MDTISVKDARQQFAQLVNSACRGQSVAITRRGKVVAQIAPISPTKPKKLPDMTEFRLSLGKPAKKSIATIHHLRQQERY